MDRIIKKVMENLEKAGFECFIVGGYVRDQLLGNASFDVDICTNALPKDIHSLFNISNANNYGGSNLKIGKFNIDITTYREEIKYMGRKPTEIKYINDIKLDLKRRDFTINAICMDSKGKIIDYVNGVDDLNNRVIRSIGVPDIKLKEDPLRILRTIRFASILNFEIEDKLYESLKLNASLVSSLSKERVKQEYSRILMDKNFLRGLTLSEKLGLNEILEIEYNDVVYSSDLLGMWAQIKIKDMPFTNAEKSNIIKITEVLKIGEINNSVLYKYGLYISTVAGMILNYKTNIINKMYNKLPIKDIKDIDIKSDDIVRVLNITPSKVVGDIYKDLEVNIIEGKLKNNKKDIIKYIEGKW